MCFAFLSRWMHKKIVNDKESTRLIIAVNYLDSHERSFDIYQMTLKLTQTER